MVESTDGRGGRVVVVARATVVGRVERDCLRASTSRRGHLPLLDTPLHAYPLFLSFSISLSHPPSSVCLSLVADVTRRYILLNE